MASKTHLSIRVDTAVVERIDARTDNRSGWVERACVAFLAHDEGAAVELAGLLRRYRLAAQADWVDVQRLDADTDAALARFRARSQYP